MRGSYQLQHLVDVALYLAVDPTNPLARLIIAVKNRLGPESEMPAYLYHRDRGLFTPTPKFVPPPVPAPNAAPNGPARRSAPKPAVTVSEDYL